MMIQPSRWLAGGILAAAALLALAGCGSSSKTSSPPANSKSSGATAAAAYTISANNVPGVGTVLVNGQGRTLYLLSSEKGGKVTCTDASGCTKFWPDTVLPGGVTHAIAGSGIQSSLLGTTRDASGRLHVTYASYPLYEFSGDQGAGTAKGEGIKSFGGTWYAVLPSGQPAMGSSSSATTPTTSGYGGGY